MREGPMLMSSDARLRECGATIEGYRWRRAKCPRIPGDNALGLCDDCAAKRTTRPLMGRPVNVVVDDDIERAAIQQETTNP